MINVSILTVEPKKCKILILIKIYFWCISIKKTRLRLTSRLAINHLKVVNQSSYWRIPILSMLFSVISCMNRIYHFWTFFPFTLSVSTKMKYIRHIYFFYNLHKVLINPSISPFTTPNIIKFPFLGENILGARSTPKNVEALKQNLAQPQMILEWIDQWWLIRKL